MQIYVIDNGGQWTHREYRVLRDLGVEVSIIPNTSPSESLNNADGIVLSGGAPSIVSELPKLGNVKSYIEDHNFPVFGICVGAQFIALNFGGKVGPGVHPEFGKAEISFSGRSPLIDGIGDRIIAWENHNDEVKELPDCFTVFGSSKTCKIQAFQHNSKPIYGVQFHPEVQNTQYGTEMFENFLKICRT